MAQLLPDLRTVLRSLSRQPGFCAVVILTLALGIGANSAIFSVVNAVLLKPLPYREPERLALLWSRWSNFDKTWLSEAEFLDYARLEAQVESAAAWSDEGDVAITGEGTPESVGAMAMSHEMLPVLGMEPAVGRGFSVAEDLPNAPPVAMIGYDLWRRRYGGDPSLVGRTITVDGTPVRVVGCCPGSSGCRSSSRCGSRRSTSSRSAWSAPIPSAATTASSAWRDSAREAAPPASRQR
ncbi:MAG: ABC transporter permease [Gemmatimonadetes bacterium]|nr:ABC transporter permease [Gemmatimonadota bacterium]